MFDGRAMQPGKPVRGRNGVVVEKHEQLTARGAGACVVACGEAEIAAGLDDTDLGVRARQQLAGTIARRVVHHDDLEWWSVDLGRKRIEAWRQPCAAVVIEHDD